VIEDQYLLQNLLQIHLCIAMSNILSVMAVKYSIWTFGLYYRQRIYFRSFLINLELNLISLELQEAVRRTVSGMLSQGVRRVPRHWVWRHDCGQLQYAG